VAKDGASNTIAMIENGKPVLWYKPDDIEFDGANAFPKLTSPWTSNKVQVAFFDGSIRTFILGKDEATWKALVTWNGGEEIDLSKIEE
jgi:prepilin-type processing-associated H-X9-DG protein